MVSFKKPITLILIFSFLLSLTSNFLYTKNREVFAEEDLCQGLSCPEGKNCTGPEYDEKSRACVCYDCSIPCEIELKTFTNQSCLPLAETGEWTCGKEIPVGEIIDNTCNIALKMQLAFEGIIINGEEMILWGNRLLADYQKWNCQEYINWEEKRIKCETDCRKYYNITAGVLQPDQPNEEKCEVELGREITRGKSVYPEKCNQDYTQCISCNEYCSQEEHQEECCWHESFKIDEPDPKNPEKTIEKEISCKYCKKEDEEEAKYCSEYCFVDSCRGCCGQYFWPIINGYTGMEELQKALKNDIEETDTPKNLKRSYILEQLDFARCQLAQCWIPAKEYTEALVGKHLLTCQQANQLGLLEEDQIACFTSQTIKRLEEIADFFEELKTAPFWKKPIIFFQLQWKVIKFGIETLWALMTGGLELTQEEGCYPGNYYCCQM